MVEFKPAGTSTFWEGHGAAPRASGLTQWVYCQEQDLRHCVFGYWVRKPRLQANDCQTTAPGCIPVTLAPFAGSLALALPNGLELEIEGIEAGNLPLLESLLEALR